MVFIPNTPESRTARILRKDSLNFDTTCHGIHPATGAACRRGFSPNNGQPARGIVTRVDGKELFFCWQHKEQAKELVMRKSNDLKKRRQEMGRSSIETLVERVEVVVGKVEGQGGRVRVEATSAVKTDQRVGSVGLTTVTTTPINGPGGRRREKGRKPSGLIRFLCCSFSFERPSKEARPMEKIVEEDVVARPARQKQTGRKASVQFSDTPLPPPLPLMSIDDKKRRPSAISLGTKGDKSSALQPKMGATNKMNQKNRKWSNQDLIPSNIPIETQLKLWDTLSKPYSEDDKPGYIYVFLLTDKPLTPAPAAAAAASSSKFLQAAAAHAPAAGKQKLLLKIGRADNVQRRLHQWTQQCSYSLQLMRFYPYAPLPQVPRQVPNSHRIERLIHIELQERNHVIVCDNCGKTHLEWFEAEASREGLRHVDGVIRKWIRFGEETEGWSPEQYMKGLVKPVKTPGAGTPQKASGGGVKPASTPTKQGNQNLAPQRNTPKKATPKTTPASTPKAGSAKTTPKRPSPKRATVSQAVNYGSPAPRRKARVSQFDSDEDEDWESGDEEIVAMGRQTKGKGKARR